MKSVILADVCDISSGGTPSRAYPEYFKGSIPWAKISDIENAENGVVYSTEESISEEGLKNIRGKTFPKGALLFAMYGSIGKTAIAGKEISTNQAILGITPKNSDEISISYLKAWFESNKKALINQGRGVALKNLSATIVRNLEIELPPLDDQIRIAHLLSKVEGLITQRKKHQQQLDDLLKSVFLEMFGDPVRNEKGWPVNPLATYMSEQPNNGLYKPQSSYGSGTKIIRIDSFYDGIVRNIGGLKRVEITDAELLKFEIRPFDVLVNRVNSIEYLGKIGVVPAISEPMVYESNMMRFRLNHEVMLPVYLMYFWRTPYLKSQINSKAKKAVNQASINQQDVTGLLVPQPSIELQRQFFTIVEKVEALKSRSQQSLADLEALYGAMSQRAFKGELDLSRVALPAAPIEGESPVAASVPAPITTPVIELPETDLLLPALQDRTQLAPLLRFWLEAYRTQLGSAAFSLERFIAAAQTRLAELHADNDFEWAASDYESMKTWVFEALAAGALTQAFDDDGNRVELRAAAEQSLA